MGNRDATTDGALEQVAPVQVPRPELPALVVRIALVCPRELPCQVRLERRVAQVWRPARRGLKRAKQVQQPLVVLLLLRPQLPARLGVDKHAQVLVPVRLVPGNELALHVLVIPAHKRHQRVLGRAVDPRGAQFVVLLFSRLFLLFFALGGSTQTGGNERTRTRLGIGTDLARPPTRSLASTTATDTPPVASRCSAADRPAKPAPTTTTSTDRARISALSAIFF